MNAGKRTALKTEAVLKQIQKAHQALSEFPSSWHKKNDCEERYAEPLFLEIELMINILGTHHQHMIEHQGRAMENRMKASSTVPNLDNTGVEVSLGMQSVAC